MPRRKPAAGLKAEAHPSESPLARTRELRESFIIAPPRNLPLRRGKRRLRFTSVNIAGGLDLFFSKTPGNFF
jgi:hypothetical protein